MEYRCCSFSGKQNAFPGYLCSFYCRAEAEGGHPQPQLPITFSFEKEKGRSLSHDQFPCLQKEFPFQTYTASFQRLKKKQANANSHVASKPKCLEQGRITFSLCSKYLRPKPGRWGPHGKEGLLGHAVFYASQNHMAGDC